jgi:hypothetical protein
MDFTEASLSAVRKATNHQINEKQLMLWLISR